MKKRVVVGICGCIAIAAAVFMFGISNLGPIVKKAVNVYGPDITGTDVRVRDVSVSLLTGQATVRDFYLGNPKGFKASQAMQVGAVYVDVDVESLGGKTVIIDRIEIVAPEITYEKAGKTNNLKTILANMQRGGAAEKHAADGGAKKMLIRHVVVRDGKIKLAMPLLGGRTVTAPLPDMHLEDIGKDQGGLSPREAFRQVGAVLYSAVTAPDVTAVFNAGVKKLGLTLNAVGRRAGKGVRSVTDKVKGLFR
ncbi:MAG: hypothetical protein GY868_09130 [Deltaproteobacteria bacterium]|nr:hypothetical protein [Deltaproteobacteria bacterium]